MKGANHSQPKGTRPAPELTGPEAYAEGRLKRETPRGGSRRALRTFSTDRSQRCQITPLAAGLQEAIAEIKWRARREVK